MKRHIYFFIERFGFTRFERKASIILLLLLGLTEIGSALVGYLQAPISQSDQIVMNQVRTEYELKLKEIQQKNKDRYYPKKELEAKQVYAVFDPDTAKKHASPSDTSQVPISTENSPLDTPSKININTASAKDFELLPGIGPKTAEKIVDYRKAVGSFQSLEDLKKVKGIGVKKFDRIKSLIFL